VASIPMKVSSVEVTIVVHVVDGVIIWHLNLGVSIHLILKR
jgi:hypothetical protein